MASKKEQILQEAENRIREEGYNSVSFRDLAAAVGIKSASVHYHFPTKEDLGEAVADRYTDAFISALGDPKQKLDEGINPIEYYISMFRYALREDKKMCLCGLLGAERDGLPETVKAATKRFFKRSIEWLVSALSLVSTMTPEQAQTKALQLISQMQGALMLSRVLEDDSAFEKMVGHLHELN